MKNILFPVLALSVFACSIKANENEYEHLVLKDCPGAEITDVEEREGFFEVEYRCNDEEMEMGIKDGEIVYKETHVVLEEELMQQINTKLEKDFSDWILDDITLISRSDSSFYSVEIEKNGLEQTLYFTSAGKKYKEPETPIEEEWDFESIYQNSEYAFHRPKRIYELPKELLEISGTELLDNNTVLCIQDELGVVFEYSLKTDQVSNIYRFADTGDFEDLTRVGNTLHVLRSDGVVFEFDYKEKNSVADQHRIAIKSLDAEGLFYDENSKMIYLANKEPAVNGDKDERQVLRYSPGNPEKAEVYLTIRISEIDAMLSARNAKKKKSVKFHPSAIAVHPLTKEMYILSANDQYLVVYADKKLKNVYPLPKNLYTKPEGISFFPNGDMLLSSEGKKKNEIGGRLMVVERSK